MSRVYSVIEGRDPDVLDTLFGFYARPEGLVIDVTSNVRRMWKGLNTDGVEFADRNPKFGGTRSDFRCMNFCDEEAAVIVFDPPHLPAAAGSAKSHAQYKEDYGLEGSVKGDNISSIFPEFLAEAHRVLKPDGLIFAKLADFVHNHRYQWTLVDFVNAVRAQPGLTPTDLIIKRDPCAGNLKSGRWVKSHHARRAHCWWVVVRKGKCEPRTASRFPSTLGRKLDSTPDSKPAPDAGSGPIPTDSVRLDLVQTRLTPPGQSTISSETLKAPKRPRVTATGREHNGLGENRGGGAAGPDSILDSKSPRTLAPCPACGRVLSLPPTGPAKCHGCGKAVRA